MRIEELVRQWAATHRNEKPMQTFSVQLPLKQAAQLLALKEMYPGCTEEQIITDLISVALDQFREALPYEAGKYPVTEDEFGDPVYADEGLTPTFINLTRKYTRKLRRETDLS